MHFPTYRALRIGSLALMMVVVLARCSGESSAPAGTGVLALTLSPPSSTMRLGTTMQLQAVATLGGVPTSTGTVTFSSDNASVVSVSAQGLARALSIGTASITARNSSGASATGVLTVIPGLPFSVSKTSGDNQTAPPGASVPVAPSVTVRDSAGNGLAGVAVSFAVSSGGGTVSGGAAMTDGAGVATVAAWSLGSAAGINTLAVTVPGVAPVTFAATGVHIPASMRVNSGDAQAASVGTTVAIAPSVLVLTAGGQPAVGVPVSFAVTFGGGAVTSPSQTTNAAGIATAGAWTLGDVGPNWLAASVAGLPPVVFTATATQPTLKFSNSSLTFGAPFSTNAASQAIDVTNGATGILTGIALSGMTYTGPGANWLTATLTSTTAPATITFTPSTSTLARGTYGASMTVTAPGATNSPIVLTFHLVVH